MVSGVNQQVLEENLRLVDLWEVDLRDFQQLTPHTIEGYLGDGRRAAEIFASANTSFTGLNKLVLRTYFTTIQQQTERPEGLSHARMKSIFTALNSLMEYLVYDELATVNPVPAFRKRYLKAYKANASESTPRQVPPDEDIRALIQSVQHPMQKAIHAVFAKTGIRRGELCALNLDSVDLVEGRLTMPPKRKRSGRLIPIDLELATVLTAYINRLGLYTSRGRDGPLHRENGEAAHAQPRLRHRGESGHRARPARRDHRPKRAAHQILTAPLPALVDDQIA